MAATVHTCKNCGNVFSGKFCNQCGEKLYSEHDKSVMHFAEESLHFLTHLDGSFFTTLKMLFSRPGQLSVDYCNGLRKRYFKPVSFFLLLVVLYLLFPVFEGLSMKLYYHVRHSLYGSFAMHKVRAALQKTGLSQEEFAKLFSEKSAKTSKFLLLVIIPLTALFFWALTFKKRKYFFDQFSFSAEINSVYLIWGFMVLPLLLTVVQWLSELLTGRYLPFTDEIVGIISYAVLCTYVGIAAKKFYRFPTSHAIGFALLFYLIHFIVVQVLYKFLLFVLVINQIH